MWKHFPNYCSLFISFIQNYNYEIYITDYLALWFVHFAENDFVNLLKASNTTLEIDDMTLKSKGIEMLSNPDKLKRANVKIDSTTMQVSMSMLFGYSLKLNLTLTEGSKEMFFQIVTQPLLKLVQDLKSSESELRHLLKKKDLEIEEYKSEGAQVARHFKTSKFNEEQHMNQFKAYSECFGLSDIPLTILERSIDLPENIIVKKELVSMKTEPSLSLIKTEQVPTMAEPGNPPVFENRTVQATVSVKREHVKVEPKLESNDPRKRSRARLNL
ncbi:uncharacterized protein LOC106134731 [Amyelois transitella]|uniref:uncharacterized protein LOC106134731 n=1 Tax=Amyelois transitella TaxID=680683 RepID=UPI002990222A|nr:uncharacterized protein LOC106134731 [Amyelois transitella]